MRLGAKFVPIRKAGKLPGATIQVAYTKEYGEDRFEMHSDAIKDGDRCIIVDDLLATGGTMKAAVDLVSRAGGVVAECMVVIELEGL
eukprot:CAMPEP_0182474982 /NCGR_PEP_ID=MMETSP1319-20130603/26588_1 /TAXON_ID=172717 /ORGANISM="Bolidomonas pacifica, Strain RCC208" /LENGTH=86 /DNA_ID=CAMNT_0024675929 /DNA_START=60 /DNA_END=317 /DNA_ORIENTATION=-